MLSPLEQQLPFIKCLALDVDGVLTDGRLIIDNQGNESKQFHTQDGMGIKNIQRAGITVAIISARSSQAVSYRMKELGIHHIYQGQKNKITALEHLLLALNIKAHEVAYAGDDLPDIPVIKTVGLGIAVANAVPEVKHVANWLTSQSGGQGAVREICDLLMHSNSLATSRQTS